MGTREQTAQAWVNAGKVESIEEYYQKVSITSEVSVSSIEHTHEDGTTHSHDGGDVEHTHEELQIPKRRRRIRKSSWLIG